MDDLKVGIAFSGGGARGLAHIGVLKGVIQAGLPIHFLSGTSMGAIVSGMYAIGTSIEEMEQIAINFSHMRNLVKLVDVSASKRGLLEGKSVRRYLQKMFKEDYRIEDLSTPLTINAVDLITGDEIVFTEGSLLTAIYSSSAVPGIFSPIRKGEQYLVDGGVLNNLPVDHIREMGAEFTIGVDVHTDPHRDRPFHIGPNRTNTPIPLPNFLLDFYRAEMIMMYKMTQTTIKRTKPDILIKPAIPPEITEMFGFTRAKQLIDLGEKAVKEAVPRILRRMETKQSNKRRKQDD